MKTNNITKVILLGALAASLLISCEDSTPAPTTWHATGFVLETKPYPTGYVYYPTDAKVTVFDAEGNVLTVGEVKAAFDLPVTGVKPGDRLLVVAEKTYDLYTARIEKWAEVPEQSELIAVPSLALLPPDIGELTPGTEEWTAYDGSVAVEADSVPENVVRIQAVALDPSKDVPLFPGDFSEERGYELASAGFLQIHMYDAAGNQVRTGRQPVKLRFELYGAQAGFLFDLVPNSGAYEVPLYIYDESKNTWVWMGEGRLVTASGQPIAESNEEAIVNGTYPAPLFMEIDYGIRPSQLGKSFASEKNIGLQEGEYYFLDTYNCDTPLVPCDEIDLQTQECVALNGSD